MKDLFPACNPPDRELPGGGLQGINSARKTEYAGPCPPGGAAHRNVLTVWALFDYVYPSGTVDPTTLRKAVDGHVLGTGQLTGTYRRV